MAKSKLYDHCDVDVTINRDKQIVTVDVNFKQHILESGRVRYTPEEIMGAIQKKGVPVLSLISGKHFPLENDVRENTSATYVFSLISKEKKPSPAPKPTKVKSKVPDSAKKTTTKTVSNS